MKLKRKETSLTFAHLPPGNLMSHSTLPNLENGSRNNAISMNQWQHNKQSKLIKVEHNIKLTFDCVPPLHQLIIFLLKTESIVSENIPKTV